MKEQLQENHEYDRNPEALRETSLEQNERLREYREREASNVEKAAEQERSLEAAQNEAYKEAEKAEKAVSPAEKRLDKPAPKVATPESSFKMQMDEAKKSMSAPSRAFSNLIHTKPVEKTSEALGSTVARPNAILFGSLFAFIITAGIYFWARHVGYPISGFETIGAFIIGWIIGIIVDFSRIMITGRQ